MIDKIRFSKKNLRDDEVEQLVQKNHLAMHYLDGVRQWNNDKTKNFSGGLSIRIDKKRTLIIEGSLHKYSNFLFSRVLTNHDRFTMFQARETYFKMIENLGLEPTNAVMRDYEIGINLVTEIEPKTVLKNIYSIGDLTNEKKFFIDPRHKDESQKTTYTHRDFRIYFKTYDKIHEMLDNKREIPALKIIRIETVHRRVENCKLEGFFMLENLRQIQNSFFDKWDKLNFLVELTAPPKTGSAKIELAKKLYEKKSTEILNEIFVQYKNKTMTVKTYYTLKRFIENWETEKTNYIPTKSAVLSKWEKVYSIERQYYIQKNNFK